MPDDRCYVLHDTIKIVHWQKSLLDLESRLLQKLTGKNTLDSIGFLLESKRNPLELGGLALDSSKNLDRLNQEYFSCQIFSESEL